MDASDLPNTTGLRNPSKPANWFQRTSEFKEDMSDLVSAYESGAAAIESGQAALQPPKNIPAGGGLVRGVGGKIIRGYTYKGEDTTYYPQKYIDSLNLGFGY